MVHGALATLMALAAVAGQAGDGRSDLAITIYNNNLGLVKEARTLALKPGLNEVRFTDVAAQIDPRTVHVTGLGDPKEFRLIEQNYEYDLISPEKLMEKFVGKRVTLVFPAVEGDKSPPREVQATLVSTQGGMVYEIEGAFHVNPPARPVLPEIPGGLISVPTLVWMVDSAGGGTQQVETSYLTGGISWSADYVGVVSADDAKVDLSGWVSIDNASGATYRDARLKLVAGDIHRAEPEVPMFAPRMEMAAAAAPKMAEEPFFEYHLYTLDRPTTIKDRQTKQISLLEAAGVPVKKIYLLQGSPAYYRGRFGELGTDLKVAVDLEMVNAEKNGLGIPLPQGVLRLYKKDSSGSLQFIGEDRVKHTPRDERISLRVGEAFDVVADRTQTDFRAVSAGRYDIEAEFQIKIRNHKEEPVTVVVREPVAGDWKVLSSSHPPTKLDANTLEFSVPVPKGGESVLTYRIAVDVK